MLDQPFHEIGRLGPPGAAIRPALRGVGEQALRHDVHGLDVVGFWHEADRHRARRQRRSDEIGAHLEQALATQRENLAMLVEREFAVIDHFAAVMVVEHALAAGGGPFHRPAQLARRPQRHHVVREWSALEAEAAADVGRYDADVVFRYMQHVRELHPYAVRILRRGIERVEIVDRIVVANRDARLHRDR